MKNVRLLTRTLDLVCAGLVCAGSAAIQKSPGGRPHYVPSFWAVTFLPDKAADLFGLM